MANWATYNGIQVPYATPATDAGLKLKNDLIILAGRSGAQNNFTATADPTVSDDETEGYSPGSEWLNTTTESLFFCVDDSPGAAVWLPLASARIAFGRMKTFWLRML